MGLITESLEEAHLASPAPSPLPIEKEMGQLILGSGAGRSYSTEPVVQPTHEELMAHFTEELKNINQRYGAATARLPKLAAKYRSLPTTVRNDGVTDTRYTVQCEEAFEDGIDIKDTFTGVLLDSIADMLRDAAEALKCGDLTWLKVELSGAEEFLNQAEEKLKRLTEAVIALVKAARVKKAMVIVGGK